MMKRCLECSTPYNFSASACPSCGAVNQAISRDAGQYRPPEAWRPNDEKIVYRDRRADIAKLLAMLKPNPPSKKWAEELKAREEAGEVLLPVQASAWRAALHRGLRERSPGDDDEMIKEIET